MLEIAEDADALKLFALQIEIFFCVLATCTTHRRRSHLQLFAAKFFVDFDFDGKAVTIPSRDVWRVKAGHCLRFHDEIFQRLI